MYTIKSYFYHSYFLISNECAFYHLLEVDPSFISDFIHED
jgi:hypothetical protein